MFKVLRKSLTLKSGYTLNGQCSRKFSNISLCRNFLLKTEYKTFIRSSSISSVRFASDKPHEVVLPEASIELPNTILDKIPDPPPVPTADLFTAEVAEALNAVSANGEPTFQSLGLGGWGPVGLIQHAMEFLHVSWSIPWWGTIVIGTICVRIVIFPLVLIAQRNSAKMNNYLPEIQTLQMKMTNARQTGNQMETARYSQEMMMFFREKGLSPIKNMIVPLAQTPVFISFFMALRGMSNCPVESMAYGGLFWFTDLTIPDQYFLLPIITSMTMAITIEMGVDGTKLSQNMSFLKYIMRAIPVIMLPFTVHFPGAILVYWVSTNAISLMQVNIMKLPKVRDYLKIPAVIDYKPTELPIQSKGFIADAKNSWKNLKVTKQMEERLRVDEQIFNQAGKATIRKTYKYDPTKVPITIQAKKGS